MVDPASPMMINIPNPMEGNSASHVSYTGLPGPAHTVVINPNNNQTVLYDLQVGGNCGANADTNTNSHSHTCHPYTYCNRHPYCDSHSDADGDTNTDAVRRKMYSDAAAPSEPSAATVVPRIGAIGGARALCSRHPACCWLHFPVCGECFHALPKPAMGITKQHESSLGTYF